MFNSDVIAKDWRLVLTQAKLEQSVKLLDDFKAGRLGDDVTNKQVKWLLFWLDII